MRISSATPASTNTSTSPSFWQVMPTAPAAICILRDRRDLVGLDVRPVAPAVQRRSALHARDVVFQPVEQDRDGGRVEIGEIVRHDPSLHLSTSLTICAGRAASPIRRFEMHDACPAVTDRGPCLRADARRPLRAVTRLIRTPCRSTGRRCWHRPDASAGRSPCRASRPWRPCSRTGRLPARRNGR